MSTAKEPAAKPGRTWNRRRAFQVAGAAVLLTGAALLWSFNPAASEVKIFPPCPFHALTGYHCPGCGSLRATHQFLNGHPWAAFRLNPLMIVTMPFLILGFFGFAPVVRVMRHPLTPIVSAIVLIAYGILRNLPAFSFLAPTLI